MFDDDQTFERFRFVILALIVGMGLGALLFYVAVPAPHFSVACLADKAENHFADPGQMHRFVDSNNTINEIYATYAHYTFVSRALLEMEIRTALQECKE